MDTQFKKGVLELCVLNLLRIEDCYGYKIANEISKKIDVSEGTIYPLLRRLKKEGYVTTYLKESKTGPPRKYYKLTKKGEKRTLSLSKQWKNFTKKVEVFLRGK
jgi:PadR family transcriptional regulator, regulatory protein PadR